MPFTQPIEDISVPIDLYSAQLKSWHITPQIAESLGLALVSNAGARLSLGFIRSTEKRSAIRIPIYDHYGDQVDVRVRWLGPPPTAPDVPPPGKSLTEHLKAWEKAHGKYGQRANKPTEVYFPPIIKWTNPPEHIVITEGELKAASATLHDVPTVGLIGWFGGLVAKTPHLKPGLEYVVTHPNVKKITILWDSDANSPRSDQKKRDQAMLAITRLALGIERASRQAGKPLELKFAFIPDLTPEGKTGVDDYLAANGNLQNVLDSSSDAYASIIAPQFFADCAAQGLYVRGMDCFWEPSSNGGLGGYSTVKAFSNWMSKYLPPEGFIEPSTGRRVVGNFSYYMKFIGRNDAEYVDFIPGEGKELPNGGYNIWEPDWVDKVPWKTSALFDKFFLRWFNAFLPNERQRADVRLWIAHLFRCPSTRHEIMLVLRGSGGSGKSLLLEHFIPRSISYNRRWTKEWSHIGQRFEDMRNCQYMHAAEVMSNEMTHAAMSSYLKKIVTQETIRGEIKGGGYYEMKNLSGKALSLNLAHRVDVERGNRRVFFPDIPLDTDNAEDHPVRIMAEELWNVYEHTTEDSRRELLGAFRDWAEDIGDDVHERYTKINLHTSTEREMAGSANIAEYTAVQFIEELPEWFTSEIIAVSHLRQFPPYMSMSEEEFNSQSQRNKGVLIPVNRGTQVKIGGVLKRFRILKNPSKWMEVPNSVLREQYELAEREINSARTLRKF